MPEDNFLDPVEIGSLFQEVEHEIIESSNPSLFGEERQTEVKTEEVEAQEEVVEEGEGEGDENVTKPAAPATKTTPSKPTAYGESIQALIRNSEEFLVYEDEDERNDYSEEEYVNLINENIAAKSQKLAEATLAQVLQGLSPTIQKVVTGELKGVKIKDIINDLQDFQEIEEIPENPDPLQKERIIKAYFRRQAKERNKDAEWVQKQVEKVVDREEVDEVYEDAKEFLSQDLEKKIQEKEQEVQKVKKEKEDFKRYHNYYVNEVLNEQNLFGISLTKEEKGEVAKVLATFVTRPTDKKEKLGITAMIDSLIHNQNPKESYKILALMALAGSAPDKLLSKLKNSAEKEVTKTTVKKLKTANNTTASLAETEKKEVKKLNNSIFEPEKG